MRANEIVTEISFKDLASNITGAFAARSGRAEFDKNVKFGTNDLFKRWSGASAQMNLDQAAPADVAAALAKWADGQLADQVAVSKVAAPTLSGPKDYANIKQYLANRVKEYWANYSQTQSTVGTYGEPMGATRMNYLGRLYSYDPNAKQWKDQTGAVIAKPDDIAKLNKEYYDQAQARKATQQQKKTATQSPASGPASVASIVNSVPANLAAGVITALIQKYGTGGAPKP